jgi:uncharacterized membrane protein YhdT
MWDLIDCLWFVGLLVCGNSLLVFVIVYIVAFSVYNYFVGKKRGVGEVLPHRQFWCITLPGLVRVLYSISHILHCSILIAIHVCVFGCVYGSIGWRSLFLGVN